MSKFGSRKHRKAAMILFGAAASMVGIYFTLITWLNSAITGARDALDATALKLENSQFAVRKSYEIQEQLQARNQEIETAEATMPRGDIYLWMLNVEEEFKNRTGVDFDRVEPPANGEPDLLPKLPYGMSVFTINGSGHYHTFGAFLADFENSFPYLRIRSLELEPAAFEASGGQTGKLRFKLEFMTPSKPTL